MVFAQLALQHPQHAVRPTQRLEAREAEAGRLVLEPELAHSEVTGQSREGMERSRVIVRPTPDLSRGALVLGEADDRPLRVSVGAHPVQVRIEKEGHAQSAGIAAGRPECTRSA